MSSSKVVRNFSAAGSATRYPKAMPPTASAAAAPASPAIVRSTRSERAGARNDQTCHSTIGSASRKPAARLTFSETMNGSATPKVTGWRCSGGSGRVSASIRRPCTANATAKPAPTATAATATRARSSPRWSTRSPAASRATRRGSRRRTLRRLPLRCPHRLDGGSRERRALELDIAARLVAAGDRALELAQPAAERAAHLPQALRPEDEQHDEAEHDQLRQSDEAWHWNLLSLGGGAGAGEPLRRGD